MLPEPAHAAACRPDPDRLEPFRDLVEFNAYPSGGAADEEWGDGNVSTQAVVYSCEHRTPADRPLDHRHDPAELVLCERVAGEPAAKLSQFQVGEGRDIIDRVNAWYDVLPAQLVPACGGGAVEVGESGRPWGRADEVSIRPSLEQPAPKPPQPDREPPW